MPGSGLMPRLYLERQLRQEVIYFSLSHFSSVAPIVKFFDPLQVRLLQCGL